MIRGAKQLPFLLCYTLNHIIIASSRFYSINGLSTLDCQTLKYSRPSIASTSHVHGCAPADVCNYI